MLSPVGQRALSYRSCHTDECNTRNTAGLPATNQSQGLVDGAPHNLDYCELTIPAPWPTEMGLPPGHCPGPLREAALHGSAIIKSPGLAADHAWCSLKLAGDRGGRGASPTRPPSPTPYAGTQISWGQQTDCLSSPTS